MTIDETCMRPLLLTVSIFLATATLPIPAQTKALLGPDDFAYVGAFRLPRSGADQTSFDYGGTALAYYPAHDSLLIVGHDWHQRVAELTIPELRKAASATELETAVIRQPLTDVLAGHRGDVGTGSVKIGGLLPMGDRLIVTSYLYYDAVGGQTRSHFTTGLDFSNLGPVGGPYAVGKTPAGFVSGYMTPIPDEWQPALGGAALTGQCCIPIISRTSYGPSASVFSPAQVGKSSTTPATWVLGYPADHPALGRCESSQTQFNCATVIGGVVFPAGTGSVLFFGRRGVGDYCYGTGTGDRELASRPVKEGGIYCYDLTSANKGTHSAPYVYQVWAYDAADLVAAKQGKKRPWQVMPYRTWTFDLPFQGGARVIGGVAYDPSSHRLFVSQANGEGTRPVIHVFTLRGV